MLSKRGKSNTFLILLICLISLSLALSICLVKSTTSPESQETQSSSSQNPEEPDIKKLVEDFSKDQELSDDNLRKINELSPEKKKEFLETFIGDNNENTALKEFASNQNTKIKEFDKNGNAILENGAKIPIKDIKKYSSDIKEGKANYKYDFREKEYEGKKPKLKEITINEGKVSYKFDNEAKIELSEGSEFDFEKRTIKTENQETEWVNMKGALKVEGNKIELDVIYDKEGQTALKDFPILKSKGGEVISPYHEGTTSIELPKDFEKPSSGNYKIFEKEGKRYTVDSTGKTRELKSSSVNLDSDGNFNIVNEAMLSKKDTGEFFTQKDTSILREETKPTNRENSFIWFNQKDGKMSVSINSIGNSKIYYTQKANLNNLELNGNVLVKNGNSFLQSDKEGGILIRKIGNTDGEFEFSSDKLYTDKIKDNPYTIKRYEGDEERFKELKGKLAIHDKEGKLLMATQSTSIEGLKKLEIQRQSNTGISRLDDVISHIPKEHHKPEFYSNEDRTGGKAHYATHQMNSALRNKFGEGFSSAAMYLGDGDYVILDNPEGITLSQLSNLMQQQNIPGDAAQTYLVGSQKDWNNHPLTFMFDEWSSYISSVHGDVSTKHSNAGLSTNNLMNFAAYNIGILDLVHQKQGDSEYYQQLRSVVHRQMQSTAQAYQESKNAGYNGRAANYINQLSKNNWFVEAANKHLGQGFFESQFR
jgi:hypothetical protein